MLSRKQIIRVVRFMDQNAAPRLEYSHHETSNLKKGNCGLSDISTEPVRGKPSMILKKDPETGQLIAVHKQPE